jgi:hypothetical protein
VSPFAADLALNLVRELEGFKRELAHFPDDERVVDAAERRDSTGNLALHVAASCPFIGTVPAAGYGPPTEFKRSGPRENIYAEIDKQSPVVR